MGKSKIIWCTHSWNTITGCHKISEGCKHCYAEELHRRFKDKFGDFNKVKFHPEKLSEPKHLRKSAIIFVNSISDTFNPMVSHYELNSIWEAMLLNPQHEYMLLTKRAERMKEFISEQYLDDNIPRGIWAGVTVENQKEANSRIPILLDIPGVNKWLSIEPLLENIDIEDYIHTFGIDWVIVGCESGRHKRQCDNKWIRDIISVCQKYSVPVFVKQIQAGNKVEKEFQNFPKFIRYRQIPEELQTILTKKIK